MSNILKPSAYKLNYRNGSYSQLGDHIKITREIVPPIVEDPTNVWYLFNCWIRFDTRTITGDNGFQGLFNLGNKYFCYFRFAGGIFSFWTKIWKRTVAIDFAEGFYTANLPQSGLFDRWEMWSVLVKGVHDAVGGEEIIVYRNGVSLALTKETGPGVIGLTFTQQPWWTISAGAEWPITGGGGLDINYYNMDLQAEITDVSIFGKENLPHANIVSFLYNNGLGIDATEYDTVDGSRLEAYLPLRDGWMNTRRPGSGRFFSDSLGVVGIGNFNPIQNVSDRNFEIQGSGQRVLTSRELYLSHTRSNDKFVHRSIPEFDHQVAWIGRSIPVADFPDAEGI